ncbi:MAG: hypothetical protein GF381_01540 [Candidatus Pacebacteria bacterium]|nr:hypothetical protein [Candidatus Paceibacterota bacterium]
MTRFFSNHRLQLVLLLFLVLLLRFYPFLLGKTLIFGDNFSLMVPGKLFTAHWLKQGVLPLWNPTILGGIPWIGDVNQSVLYPTSLLFMVLEPATALNLSLVLHLGLSFVGAYLAGKKFSRSDRDEHHAQHRGGRYVGLITAVLWTLSTQVAGSLNNLSVIQSLSWLPWLAYLGQKVKSDMRSQLLFGLAVTMQFLGGYPQHVVYSIGLGVVLSLGQELRERQDRQGKQDKQERRGGRRRLRWLDFWSWLKNWLLTAIWSVGLSAFIWLPFIEVFLRSTRMELSLAQAKTGSLHPALLIKMVIPYFFNQVRAGFAWGPVWAGKTNDVFYFGWLGLVVLGFKLFFQKKNWTDWLLLSVASFYLIFSLGEYLPGYSLIQQLLPLFRVGRYPSMALLVSVFLLVLLIAQTLPELIKKLEKVRLDRLLVGLLLVWLILVACYGLLRANFDQLWTNFDRLSGMRLTQSQFHTLERDQIIAQEVLENLLVSVGVFGLSLLLIKKKKKGWLAVLLALDLFYATQLMFLFAPAQVYQPEQPAFLPINSDQAQHRLLIRNSNHPYTGFESYWEALAIRRPFSDSFVEQEELAEFNHAQMLKQGLTPDWNMVYQQPVVQGYTTLFPRDYAKVWQQSAQTRINSLDQIEVKDRQGLLADWAVKYYLVDNWFQVEDELEGLPVLEEKGRWSLYQLPSKSRFRFEDGSALDLSLAQLEETPNKIKLEFENLGHEKLILADRFDPNWKVKINDQVAQIEQIKGMRQIKLVEGKNELIFSYQPVLFYIGIVISLVFSTLIFWLPVNKN